MELPQWSRYDCNSFEIDENQFAQNNSLSLDFESSSSYPLSVMHDRIWEILNPAVQFLLNRESIANPNFDCLEADQNVLLFATSLYITADSLYKNQVKRDLVPNYVLLFEVLAEFVQKLLKYKIFVELHVLPINEYRQWL